MKTRCPGCNTTFRVTPEQIRARAGKVRCGKCAAVFNALDSLLEEEAPPPAASVTAALPEPIDAAAADDTSLALETPAETELTAAQLGEPAPETQSEPWNETAAHALAKAAGLIAPRETTEIPGYNKWAEGGVSGPASSTRSAHWPFTLSAFLLVLALAGQVIFHFRSEMAIAAPSLRPALSALSEALGSSIPLPRQADLMSIETSDLQADPLRGNLLILQATLRNRAAYAQAYPLLELSLTDTQDNAIARRVFQPGDYLPQQTPAGEAFPANADLAVRLWIEVKEISAAGYRLYVFYP